MNISENSEPLLVRKISVRILTSAHTVRTSPRIQLTGMVTNCTINGFSPYGDGTSQPIHLMVISIYGSGAASVQIPSRF